jgi:hypothetical protein
MESLQRGDAKSMMETDRPMQLSDPHTPKIDRFHSSDVRLVRAEAIYTPTSMCQLHCPTVYNSFLGFKSSYLTPTKMFLPPKKRWKLDYGFRCSKKEQRAVTLLSCIFPSCKQRAAHKYVNMLLVSSYLVT